ncbi:hypothetical protein Bca101_058261 [Brassica carinata]
MRGSSPFPTSFSSSPATRRGKKNGSEKPKQPQRGLGVAQLEKIRLHSEMSCNSFNKYNPFLHPQEDVRGYPSIPSSSPSFTYSLSTPTSASSGFYPNMMEPSFTRRNKSLGWGTQNSGSSDSQELDLELRLSL